MKKSIILTLVLMLTLPAYCFASPGKSVPTNEKSPLDENVVTEIMWALEDGIIEQDEIENIIEIAQFDNSCEYSITLIWSGFLGAMAGIAFGGAWNPQVTTMMLFLIVNAYVNCYVFGPA